MEIVSTKQVSRYSEVLGLYVRAAEAGSVEAINGQAMVYDLGIGIRVSRKRAAALRAEAAAKGSIGANMTLVAAYDGGYPGYKRDPSKAFQHLRMIAETRPNASLPSYANAKKQSALAKWQLGMRLLNGDGAAVNEREAYRWVASAADEGNISGMISRAVMLAMGQGVTEDDVAARSWYQKALGVNAPGRAHAMRGLGGMLATGEGGPADPVTAYAYLTLAAEGGDALASRMIGLLGDVFTPEVQQSATPVIERWKADNPPLE